jgi:hypothetical protein
MRKAWDPQQPVETLFKHIQDCVDFAEAGGVAIRAAQKLLIQDLHSIGAEQKKITFIT